MVGPPQEERKVLRDTEGERFVLRKKFALFQANFKDTSMNIWAMRL